MIRFKDFLRIPARKKKPQIKLQHIRKVWIWTFGSFLQQLNSLYEVLVMKQNCQKNKVVTHKNPFFVIVHFILPIIFVLALAFYSAVFIGKCCLFNLSSFNYNTVHQFFERGFRFSKHLFQSESTETVQNFQ